MIIILFKGKAKNVFARMAWMAKYMGKATLAEYAGLSEAHYGASNSR